MYTHSLGTPHALPRLSSPLFTSRHSLLLEWLAAVHGVEITLETLVVFIDLIDDILLLWLINT